MIVDEEVYLEHFGTKGMKWGVRHRRPDEAQRAKQFGPQKKMSTKKKAAIGAGVVVAAGAGALFVKHHVDRNTKLSMIRSVTNAEARRSVEVGRMHSMGMHKEARNLGYFNDKLNASDRTNLYNKLGVNKKTKLKPDLGKMKIKDLPKGTKLTPEQNRRVQQIMYKSTQRQNRSKFDLVDYRRSLGLPDNPPDGWKL